MKGGTDHFPGTSHTFAFALSNNSIMARRFYQSEYNKEHTVNGMYR